MASTAWRSRDAHGDWAMLAVQGPDARATIARRASLDEGELPARMRTATLGLAGRRALVCGTGYTGEDGCELMLPPDGAAAVWDALLEQGVAPAGLGARDTLRLEVCFHLYGNDLSEDRNPIEAGLGWCCKLDTGFIGADALRGLEPRADARAVRLHRAGHPAPGQPGARPSTATAWSPAARMSPCLEIGIGMAYVPVTASEPGTTIEVDVRGKARAAEVRKSRSTQRR